MRVAVVGTAQQLRSSRDPIAVTAGLRSRGHQAQHLDVVAALPLPLVRYPRSGPAADWSVDVVVAMGADSVIAAELHAHRLHAPLVKCLPPKDLPPLGQRETAELLVSHAPLAALVVESARCRVLAASIGAVPSQTYVIAPGVPPGSADVHHDRGTARTARILVDLSACSSLDESFVDHVLARIVDEVGVPVHRG